MASKQINTEKVKHLFESKIHYIRYVFILGSILLLIWVWYIMQSIPNHNLKDTISCVTGCAVIITIFFSIMTYEFNSRKTQNDYKNAKDTLSFNTSIEWFKPGIYDHVINCQITEMKNPNLLKLKDGEEFYKFVYNIDNISYKKSLICVLNYLESVSLGVKQGLLDEKFVKGFFASIFNDYRKDYIFYITYRREVTKNYAIWENFTNLAQKWEGS